MVFGVTADELKQAVKQVGTSADAIGKHFKKQALDEKRRRKPWGLRRRHALMRRDA